MNKMCCDICGSEIKGAFIKAIPDDTDCMVITMNREDICMECWKAIKNTRRIPLVEFPNTEAKDHE